MTNVTRSTTNPSTFTKTAGGTDWNAQVYSSDGYLTAYASCTAGTTSGHAMFGLTTDPATNASYDTIDYAWYIDVGVARIYENGGFVANYSAFTISTVFLITYDGGNVRYYLDNVLQRTVARSLGSNLFFDASIYETNFFITNVAFGVYNVNAYRPFYSNITATSLSTSNVVFGTYYSITNSAFSNITIGTINFTVDSNAFYVFRNNTGTYLSVSFGYTNAGSSFPTSPVTIAPANSVTMMIGAGGLSNYVLF
jgi:hypothetical protein